MSERFWYFLSKRIVKQQFELEWKWHEEHEARSLEHGRYFERYSVRQNISQARVVSTHSDKTMSRGVVSIIHTFFLSTMVVNGKSGKTRWCRVQGSIASGIPTWNFHDVLFQPSTVTLRPILSRCLLFFMYFTVGSYWIIFLLENKFNILFKFYVGSRSSPIYECQRVRFCRSNGPAALNLAYYS